MKDNIKPKGQIRAYLAWPLLLSLIVICGNFAVLAVDYLAAAAMLIFTLFYILAAVWIYLYRRKRLLGGLVEFSAEYAWIQKQLLAEMALPYALADDDGRLLWTNQAFQEVLGSDKASGKNLLSLFPEVTKTDLETDEDTARVHTTYGERKFRLDLKPMYMSGTEEEDIEASGLQKMLAVYLFDQMRSSATSRRSPMKRWLPG